MSKYLDSNGLLYLWGKVKSYVAGKQDAAAAGDGIDITETAEGPKIGVTTPVQGIVTQAAFNALPEARRNKGLYVISDGGTSTWDVYSTEERTVGTWIDGKPIYQATFTGVIPQSPVNTNLFLQEIPNFERLVDLSPFIVNGEGLHIFTPNYGSSFSVRNGRLAFYSDNDTWLLGKPYIVTLRYTKTTDEGGTA